MTGASGVIYGLRLLEILQERECEIHLVMSNAWHQVAKAEGHTLPKLSPLTTVYSPDDYNVPIASGSQVFSGGSFDGMVIAPCSGSSLACIAAGINRHLIHRVAEVQLKERRRLVLLFRESPLSLIHIKNMERITSAGGIIQTASPVFYDKPQTVADIVDSVVLRTTQLLTV
jgi:4-hydroxy-3-polyprenylbenzoate decarboxylase